MKKIMKIGQILTDLWTFGVVRCADDIRYTLVTSGATGASDYTIFFAHNIYFGQATLRTKNQLHSMS